MSPRKSPRKTRPSLSLSFTGRMSVIVEIEEGGPIHFFCDGNVAAVREVLQVLLKALEDLPVSSYGAEEQQWLARVLDVRPEKPPAPEIGP